MSSRPWTRAEVVEAGKHVARELLPPGLFKVFRAVRKHGLREGLSRFARNVPDAYEPPAGAAIGAGTRVKGVIDIREPGGSVSVGSDCVMEGTLVTEAAGARIQIGNNVFIGSMSLLDSVVGITVEDDVLISFHVNISDTNAHSIKLSERVGDLAQTIAGHRRWDHTVSRPVHIGRGAWIGMRAVILKGVTIGEGAVVGAGSVVSQDVAPWTIVAGNPARVVKQLAPHER